MPKKLILTDHLSKDEHQWLDRDYQKGEIVYTFHGCTYGAISHNGIAVTEKPGDNPFFEIPYGCFEDAQ